MDGGLVFVPGVPGFPPGASRFSTPLTQEAPGGSRGTPGMHAFPGAMRYGFEPGKRPPPSGMDGGVVFIPGVPGFPPGASWIGDGTDPLFTGRQNMVRRSIAAGAGVSSRRMRPAAPRPVFASLEACASGAAAPDQARHAAGGRGRFPTPAPPAARCAERLRPPTGIDQEGSFRRPASLLRSGVNSLDVGMFNGASGRGTGAGRRA